MTQFLGEIMEGFVGGLCFFIVITMGVVICDYLARRIFND